MEETLSGILTWGLIVVLVTMIFGPIWVMRLWRQVRTGRLYLFACALRNFVRRNQPLVGAVQALRADGVVSERLVNPIVGQLWGGASLAQALSANPAFFPPEYTALVNLGERTGQLSLVLDHIVADIEERRRSRDFLFNRLSYPMLVLFFYFTVAQFIGLKILPKFRDIFKEFDLVDVPTIDLFGTLIAFASLAALILVLVFIGSIVSKILSNSGAWQTMTRARRVGRTWSAKFPTGRRYELARLSAAMGTAIAGGATIPKALGLSAAVAVGSMRQGLLRANELVTGGLSLGDALEQTGAFPRTFVWMVRSGEAAGQLTDAFRQLHDLYIIRAGYLVQLIGNLIVPATVLIMASIVGLLAWSVLGSEVALLKQMTSGAY